MFYIMITKTTFDITLKRHLRTFHNGHPSPKVEKLYDSFSVQVFIFCHIIDAYCSFPINPSIYNILRWVAWTMGQMAH